MTMANGTSTQQDKKLNIRPTRISKELRPDAPEGEWKFSIPRSKSKIRSTRNGDPMLVVAIKLDKAEDEKNESFQGSEVSTMIVFFPGDDASKRRAANMTLLRLRSLCDAIEVDFDEVPDEITERSLGEFLSTIEGKRGTCWTKHSMREDPQSGEQMTNVDVLFKDPNKSGLRTSAAGADDEDEDETPRAKKSGKRR
jgi:hypothetical protein